MPAERYRAVVERVHEWTPRTRSLFLAIGGGDRMPFRAGQFVSLELPIGDHPPLVRPYSLASMPDDPLLEICVDRVPGGVGSTYLFSLARGAAVAFKGPFGTLTADTPRTGDAVFIAGGTGIAPLRPIVRQVLAAGGPPVHVVHGAATEEELLFRDELHALVDAHPGCTWKPVLEGAAAAAGEHPTLERLVFDRFVDADGDRTRQFWIAAVGDVVRRLREALRGAGYERRAVRYEQW